MMPHFVSLASEATSSEDNIDIIVCFFFNLSLTKLTLASERCPCVHTVYMCLLRTDKDIIVTLGGSRAGEQQGRGGRTGRTGRGRPGSAGRSRGRGAGRGRIRVRGQ